MKTAFFRILVVFLVIALTLTLIISWQKIHKGHFKRLGINQISIPEYSQYIPKNADLTVYWNLDSWTFEKYLKKISNPKRVKDNKNNAIELRNSMFSIIGIDFDKDLKENIEGEVGFTLLENEKEERNEWMIFLKENQTSEDKKLINKLIENRSKEGRELKNESYKGYNIYSLKNLSGKDFNNDLAICSLDNYRFTIVASSHNIIKESINTYENPDSNQFNDIAMREAKDYFQNGIAFIMLSPKTINEFLWKRESSQIENDNEKIFLSLSFKDKNIVLNSFSKVIQNNKSNLFIKEELYSILNEVGGDVKDLAVLNQPSKEENINSINDNLKQVVMKESNSNLPALIIKEETGPLIWIKEPSGWLIGTKKNMNTLKTIEESILKEGFKKSSIFDKDEEIRIWSRQYIEDDSETKKLRYDILTILKQSENNNWWAENLEAINEKNDSNKNKLINNYIEILNKKQDKEVLTYLDLGKEAAKRQISRLNPFILMQSLTGKDLKEYIQGAEIEVRETANPEENNNYISIHSKIRLD